MYWVHQHVVVCLGKGYHRREANLGPIRSRELGPSIVPSSASRQSQKPSQINQLRFPSMGSLRLESEASHAGILDATGHVRSPRISYPLSSRASRLVAPALCRARRSCRRGNGCLISDVGRGLCAGAGTAPPGGGHWCGCCHTPVAPCSGTISPSATPVGPGPGGSPTVGRPGGGPRAHVIGNPSDRPSGAGPPGGVSRPGGRVLVRIVAPEVALQAWVPFRFFPKVVHVFVD
jgi:hypothetical protein